MNPQKVTEADQAHVAWHKEAQTVTLDTLHEFVRKLVGDYEHDYGTICHAMAAAMAAAMSAVNKSSQGGITGFQAGCVMWEVLKHSFHVEGPARLLSYRDLLFPQYERKFTAISNETWQQVREMAQKELLSFPNHGSAEVKAHMTRIAEGFLPFGLTVSAD